jgi:hypothetical protein
MVEIIIIGDVLKIDHSLILSNIFFKWSHLHSKSYSRVANKLYGFSAVLEWSFNNFEKNIGATKMDQ